MSYLIEAIKDGYRLSIPGETRDLVFTESGGHGPLEALFAHAEQAWDRERAGGMPAEGPPTRGAPLEKEEHERKARILLVRRIGEADVDTVYGPFADSDELDSFLLGRFSAEELGGLGIRDMALVPPEDKAETVDGEAEEVGQEPQRPGA